MNTKLLIISYLFICLLNGAFAAPMDEAWIALSQNNLDKASQISSTFINKNDIRSNSISSFKSMSMDESQIAVAHFIQAEISRIKNNKNQAKKHYQVIIDSYPQALCEDPRGWTWNLCEVSKDKLMHLDTDYDFGDYSSSTLIVKAWECLQKKDSQGVLIYASKCIDLFEQKANQSNGENNQWALNDVGAAYFILGEYYLLHNDQKQAKLMFEKASQFDLARCFDPKGWFWKISDVSKDKIKSLETGYDFLDYKSSTLTKKAWACLGQNDFKGMELYASKCIFLYSGKAKEMSKSLSNYARSGFNPYFWALNDVGTCYYILGQGYLKMNNKELAIEMFQKVIDEYPHAQCWDPRGWYWKVPKACLKTIHEIS